MTKNQFMSVAVAVIAMLTLGETAQAGWGSYGGSYGSYGSRGGSAGSIGYSSQGGGSYGSYGSRGGSSGGYTAAYSSYGSTGSGSSGASNGSGGSSYGSGGSTGHVGLLARLRAHRAARASSGGSNGSYGSYGSSGGSASSGSGGGSYGSYKAYRTRSYSSGGSGGSSGYSSYRYSGSSHGSTGSASVSYSAPSYGGSSGGSSIHYHSAPVQSAPIYHEHSAPVDSGIHGESIMETPIIDNGSYNQTRSESKRDEALLTMTVPADASVYVNGNRTSSTGTNRQFVSRGLEPGKSYSYEIRIVSNVDGRNLSETKTVRLRAGESRALAYSAPATPPAIAQLPVETVLTVNVPADAKVTLAGNATSAEGTSRTFRTKQLKPGEVWSDYVVSVQAKRNGRTVTQQKTIKLVAGQTPELTFDFADATVAMR